MKTAKLIFRYSVLLQGILWVVFAIVNYFSNNFNTVIAVLMAANGVCFLVSALLFDKSLIFRLGIFLFLALNLILTFTDQMGFFDYTVLVMNIVSVISLSIYSAKYRKS